MKVVTVSLDREAKGNILKSVEGKVPRLTGIVFHGLFRRVDAPMEEGLGSICVYALSRTPTTRTYHARVSNEHNERVAEILYTVPTGEYEIFVTQGFRHEKLFIRFVLNFQEEAVDD